MPHFEISQFICRSDNYGVLLHDAADGTTVSIDAPDAGAIEAELLRRGWRLTHLLITHHHPDHVEGIPQLVEKFGCPVIGPAKEAGKIAGLTQLVTGGDSFMLGNHAVNVYDCPGHTLGHIAFHVPGDNVLFAADTLFSLGCGRVFEGTPEQMYHSVNQFAALKPATRIYCGHEYTEANGKFALSVEPGNAALQKRVAEVKTLRDGGHMTCPTSIAQELATNPYLRCNSPEIRKVLGMEQASDAEVFAELRQRKNNFG